MHSTRILKIGGIIHTKPKPYSEKNPVFPPGPVEAEMRTKPTFQAVAIGGTFDVFHRGHEQLLAKSFRIGERVVIGVTSDQLVQTLGKKHPVRPYRLRVREIRRFLQKQGWTRRARISSLKDPYGPAAVMKDLQALVVTPNTLASGKKLNRIRKAKGLKPVAIRKIPFAKAEDGRPISTTRIWNGEIDRDGKLPR